LDVRFSVHLSEARGVVSWEAERISRLLSREADCVPGFRLARVLGCLNHIASRIVNANHGGV